MSLSQTEIKISSRRVVKTKSNQTPVAAGALIIAITIALMLYQVKPFIVGIWIFGFVFGFILQKSRFCFTASLRDPILTGSTSLSKAVLIAIMVSSVGFAVMQYMAMQRGVSMIPGNVMPVGPHVAIGAILFGFGMVIAGACASGSLMRVGEGYLLQIVTLAGMIIGSTWGAHDFYWWKKLFIAQGKSVFLPKLLGWPLALTLQFGLLIALYFLAHWYQSRKKES